MKYKEFIEFIIKIKDFNLKGKLAHKKMAPYNRISENEQNKINNFTYKEAAVLILIYPSDKGVPSFVLIERSISSGVHSGQISLPGGKKEKNDKSFWDTSIRETNEEIGVNLSKINFLKKMSCVYVPPSNFMIYPFIGYLDKCPFFNMQKEEVQNIFEINILDLLKNKNKSFSEVRSKYMNNNIKVPVYNFMDKIIWGATAMILSEFELFISDNLKKKYI